MCCLGIIGGMGPLATADLYNKIVNLTRAENDQDHIHVIIDSNPAIPDRTRAILHGGASPLYELVRSAHRLENMGADILMMACNTAHYYYDEISPFISAPMLNMIEAAAEMTLSAAFECVGLLATDATCQIGVYDRFFEKSGIKLLKPSPSSQKNVMEFIYDGVKAGNAKYPPDGLKAALKELSGEGAQAFILGCTELPVAFRMYGIDAVTIDPTEALARIAVIKAGKKLKL